MCANIQDYRYWPDEGRNKMFGNIRVTVEKETAEHFYIIRVISLSNPKVVSYLCTIADTLG